VPPEEKEQFDAASHTTLNLAERKEEPRSPEFAESGLKSGMHINLSSCRSAN